MRIFGMIVEIEARRPALAAPSLELGWEELRTF